MPKIDEGCEEFRLRSAALKDVVASGSRPIRGAGVRIVLSLRHLRVLVDVNTEELLHKEAMSRHSVSMVR